MREPNGYLHYLNTLRTDVYEINALLNADREQQCTPCQYCMFIACANLFGNPVPPTPFPYPSPNYPPRPDWQKYLKTSTPSTDCNRSIKQEYLSLYRDFKHASQIELRDHISSGATPSDCRQQPTRTTDLGTSPEISPDLDEATERDIRETIHPFISGIFTTLVEEYLKLFEEMVNSLILLKATGITLDDICHIRESHTCKCHRTRLGKVEPDGIDKPYNAEEFERLLRNEIKNKLKNRSRDKNNRIHTQNPRVTEHINRINFTSKESEVCDCEQASVTNNNPFLTFLTEISWPATYTRHTTEEFDKIIHKGKKTFLKSCLKLLNEDKSFRSHTLHSPSNIFHASFTEVGLPKDLILKISVKIYNLTISSVQSAIYEFFKTMQYDAHKSRRRVLPPIPDKTSQYQGVARTIESKNQIQKSLSQYMMSDLSDSLRDDVFESTDIDPQRTPVHTQFSSLKYDDPDEVFKRMWPTLQYEYEAKPRRHESIKRRHSQYEPLDQNKQAYPSFRRQYPKYAEPAKRHTYYGHDSYQLHVPMEQESAAKELQKKRFDETTKLGNARNEYGLERYKTRLATLQKELRKLQHDMGLLQNPHRPREEDISTRHSLHEPRNIELGCPPRARYKSEPYDIRSKAYTMRPTQYKHIEHADIAYRRNLSYDRERLLRGAETTRVSPEMKTAPRHHLSTDIPKYTRIMYTSNRQSRPRRRSYTFSNKTSYCKYMLRSRSLPDLRHKEIQNHYVNTNLVNNHQSYRWTESLKFQDAVTNILNMWTYDMIDYEKGANIPRLRNKIMNYRKRFARLMKNDIKEKYCYRHILSVFKRIEENESPILDLKKPVSTPSYPLNCKITRSRSCHSKLRYKTMKSLRVKDDFSSEIDNWVHKLVELEKEASSPHFESGTKYRNKIMRPNSFHLEPNTINRDERTESDALYDDSISTSRNTRQRIFLDFEKGKQTAQMKSDILFRRNLARPRSLHSEVRHPTTTAALRPKSDSLLHSDILPQLNAWKRNLQKLEKEVASPHLRYESLKDNNTTRANFISETKAATSVTLRPNSESVINDYSNELKVWRHNLLEIEKNSRSPHLLRPKTLNRKNMPRAHSLHSESINETVIKQRPKSVSVLNKEDITAKINTRKQELQDLQKTVEIPYSIFQTTGKNMANSRSLHSKLQPGTIHRYNVDALKNKSDKSRKSTLASKGNVEQLIINDKPQLLYSEFRPATVYRSNIEALKNKSDIARRNTYIPSMQNIDAPISGRTKSTQYKPTERRYSATTRQLPAVPNKKTRRHSHYETTGNFIHLLADRKATHLNARSVAAYDNANYKDGKQCPQYLNETSDDLFTRFSTYSDDSSSTRVRFFSE